MKFTKETRKHFYTQYRWIYALSSGIGLMSYFYGHWMIRQRYEFDPQGAWMTWGQFLAVGLVAWLAGLAVDAVLGKYAYHWGEVKLTRINRWAKYLWWLMIIGMVIAMMLDICFFWF